MKPKVAFKETVVNVEGRNRKIWVLETPSFLKQQKNLNYITKEYYEERVRRYNLAIDLKETLPEVKEQERLRDYQLQTINHAKDFNSFAIFDEPRLGKTPTTIGILKEKGLLNKNIIVMSPSNVISNWIKAFKEWGGIKAYRYNGETPKGNVLIMTYARAKISYDDLVKWKPDVSILDEAHKLRNSRGKAQQVRLTGKQKERKQEIDRLKTLRDRGFTLSQEQKDAIKNYKQPLTENKAILLLGSKAKYRYALTGTPNVNKPEEIFAIFQFILPKFFKSYWSFIYYYFTVTKSYWGNREIGEPLNHYKEKELQELLNYLSTRNLQEEKMKWLKQPKITYTYLELTRDQKNLEEQLLEKGLLGEKYILTTLEQIIHYQTICLEPKINQDLKTLHYSSKTLYLLDYLVKNPKQNIGIFSTRDKYIDFLIKIIERGDLKRKILKIDNKKIEDIQRTINEKTPKEGYVVLGTIGKSKEGISLVGLSKAFITDQSWVPSDSEQLIHRLDATTPEEQEYFGKKEFEILHHKNTVDDMIQEAINMKLSTTDFINNYKKFIERRKKNGRRN